MFCLQHQILFSASLVYYCFCMIRTLCHIKFWSSALSIAKHIDHISHSAYLEIGRISSIHHLLTRKVTAQLMGSFVLSRFDYCNS